MALDLGYFLQGALTVEDRRRSERDLLAEYRDALGLPADELPSTDEIWLRYRASVAHGLAIRLVTASAGEWQRTDCSVALAQRYSFAYADWITGQRSPKSPASNQSSRARRCRRSSWRLGVAGSPHGNLQKKIPTRSQTTHVVVGMLGLAFQSPPRRA